MPYVLNAPGFFTEQFLFHNQVCHLRTVVGTRYSQAVKVVGALCVVRCEPSVIFEMKKTRIVIAIYTVPVWCEARRNSGVFYYTNDHCRHNLTELAQKTHFQCSI